MNVLVGLLLVCSGASLNDELTAFPIGFWNVESIERFTEQDVAWWGEAGITLTHGPRFETTPENVAHMNHLLTWAGGRNIKLIVADPRTRSPRGKALPEGYAAGVAEAVKDFGLHRANFGFKILDEPAKADLPTAISAMKTVEQAMPRLHPFVNQFPWHGQDSPARVGYPSWTEFLDDWVAKSGAEFLCYDCYSQMNPGQSGWPMYFQNLNEYRGAAARANIPFWTIILSTAHFKYREPSEDDVRWQFNTALAYGAQGIFYYNWYTPRDYENWRMGPIDEFGERTPVYHAIKRVNKTFQAQYGRLFLDLNLVKPMQWPEPIEGCLPFEDDGLLKAVGTRDKTPLIVSRFHDKQDRSYVAMVNNTTDQNTVGHLTFHGGKTSLRHLVWGPTEVKPRNLRVGENDITTWHWLAPGQMEVYRVEPEPAS